MTLQRTDLHMQPGHSFLHQHTSDSTRISREAESSEHCGVLNKIVSMGGFNREVFEETCQITPLRVFTNLLGLALSIPTQFFLDLKVNQYLYPKKVPHSVKLPICFAAGPQRDSPPAMQVIIFEAQVLNKDPFAGSANEFFAEKSQENGWNRRAAWLLNSYLLPYNIGEILPMQTERVNLMSRGGYVPDRHTGSSYTIP
ncbi:hypothetical protein HYALB_00006630 [Hymenoscyphus albidus]|uniref:Uncharacterized protein n=1 Tax=Hymenoscyphus albidus TaxID=595503 RepID=A0A9N9M4A5_9HELO|nr:hypothetical protein HYALB_00006630 [Hymenoscyphus albidus]